MLPSLNIAPLPSALDSIVMESSEFREFEFFWAFIQGLTIPTREDLGL